MCGSKVVGRIVIIIVMIMVVTERMIRNFYVAT